MTDDEALAVLKQLPETTRISKARLRPGDVIVVECEKNIPRPVIDVIRHHLGKIWPGHQIVVLDGALKLKIAPPPADLADDIGDGADLDV